MHRLLPVLALTFTPRAEAFTTRVHLALANDLRASLLASPDGRTIRLAGGDAVVRLTEDDARALRDWPLAFRAGAIGPDNFVFPAMTDLTHAVGLRPYDQCEDLYRLAETDEERAYAMGCFLHGASDAVVHHLVNDLTGETFTLNPITAGRAEHYSNVVRHIVAEAMIQESWLRSDPDAFSAAAMVHAIPADFVQRAVLSPDSPVWQRMTTHALPAWEATDPDALLIERVAALEVVPAEHLALMPLYVDAARADLDEVIPALRADLAELQDPLTPDGSELGVTPGPDSLLGTEDDDTDCLLTCPTLYASYFTLVSLLEPRADHGGTSAMDELVDDVRADLDGLMPAYLQTVAETSALLNAPLAPDGPSFDVDDLDPDVVTGPLEDWGTSLVSVDWDLVAHTLLPSWIVDLEAFLSGLGVPVDLGAVLQGWLQPKLDQIRDGVLDRALSEIEVRIDGLVVELEDSEAAIRAEYTRRLADSAPAGHGSVLDDLPHSGLYVHSFNLVAVTLAEHRVVLPTDDAHAGVGPASFDASYTVSWSQAARCAPMQAAVLPLGPGLAGLLSLRIDGETFPARVDADSPIECHDGRLDAFAVEPDPASCALTGLPELLADPVGSISRAFPPEAVDVDVACLGLVVEGLPEAVDDPRDRDRDRDAGGCGCAGLPGGPWALWPLLLVLAACRREPEEPTGSEPASTPPSTPTSGTWSTGPAWDLAQALGTSSWHGRADRGDGERVWELTFDGPAGLVAEVRNPWGPGRTRTLRSFTIDPDGRTLHTRVTTPGGWEPSPLEGEVADWTVDLVDGDLVLGLGGATETWAPGPEPSPAEGMTAVARAFTPGGWVDAAFCDSGAAGFDYDTLFSFARGGFDEELAGEDIVAGSPLDPWLPVGGAFALADVPGFSRDGGTAVDAPRWFVVRAVGTLDHPGGTISIRESDDTVEDGVWVWLGDGVGGLTNDWFLEVHGFLWPDGTPDAPTADLAAGPLPIEVITIRCDEPIRPISLEISLGGGPFQPAATAPWAPDLSPGWFPPAL